MVRRTSFRFVLFTFIAAFLVSVGLYFWLFADLPDSLSLANRDRTGSTKIYDRNGSLLYEMPEQNAGKRTRVTLDEYPPYLLQATIATEDGSFYDNAGVDFSAIVRALIADVRGRQVLSGASTIAQQLVRSTLMPKDESDQRTLRRKVREAALAFTITRLYTKDAILEAYLNEIYYGNMAYGAEAAAEAYFAKPARNLDLAESALLAGLPQSPADYNPLTSLDAALRRQAVVLDLMVDKGYITQQEAEMARGEKLAFAAAPFDIKAPHFVARVMDVLESDFSDMGIGKRGLRVVTTLDYGLQSSAEAIIRTQLARLTADHVTNASLIALDPRTGDILAMVGSADYFDKNIDGAVNVATSLRQPGSSIKPLTYALAFSRGWSPGTIVADVRTAFPTREGTPFVPANYDLTYHGPVSLRQALGSSINMAAVKVLDYVSIPAFIDFAHQLGISSLAGDSRYGLSLTLGGGEITLLDLTSSYAIFANQGAKLAPRSILRIEDNIGKVLYRRSEPRSQQVVDQRVAYLISDVLSDDSARLLTFGSHSPLSLSQPAAVKTGTTSAWRDNWTIGYTPNLVAGVWAGNADGSPMKHISGVTGAAPIWHDFMEEAMKLWPAEPFVEPPGLVHVDICPESGQLPGAYCPYTKREVYIAGDEPTETCIVHQKVRISKLDGLLAPPDLPDNQVKEVIYAIYPPELTAWAEEMGLPRPPTRYPTARGETTGGLASYATGQFIRLTSPDQGSIFQLDPSRPTSMQRIEIAASSPVDPTAIRFTVDGGEIATLNRRPYSFLWQLVEGDHIMIAIALDGAGNELARSQVRITVAR